MDNSHAHLSETHTVGRSTRQWIVRAEECPALRWHQIRHVGIADASNPYKMVRTNLSGAYLLACFAGEGRILLDGRWRNCRSGMACLAPPHVLHAFRCVPGERWSFCWVRYEQPQDQRPFISASAPVLAPDVENPVTPPVAFGSVTPADVWVVMPVGLLEPSPTTYAVFSSTPVEMPNCWRTNDSVTSEGLFGGGVASSSLM